MRTFNFAILMAVTALLLAGFGTRAANAEVPEMPGLHVAYIVINLADQRLYAFDPGGSVILEYACSSGKGGHSTPKGDYFIKNKAVQAYSKKYSATMTHWMAITADGAYGIHGLLGSSYYSLLGRPASHGCIRLAREHAKELYSLASVGTPVSIVHDPDLGFLSSPPVSSAHGNRSALIAEVVDRLYGNSSY